jgi:hypothetical protein
MASIFDTPRNNSHEARAIIVHPAKYPLTDVMLTLYTTYHIPLHCLLFSYLEHDDLKTLIETFHWMKPLMNYSGFQKSLYSRQCIHVAVSGFLFMQFKRHLNTVQMYLVFLSYLAVDL